MTDTPEPRDVAGDPQHTRQARLDQQMAFLQRWLDHQEKAIKFMRFYRWICVAVLLLMGVFLVVVVWIARNNTVDNSTGWQTTQSYRFTAAQLVDIRDAEERFKGVKTISGVVDAFGQPDAVIDQTYSPSGVLSRTLTYTNRWPTINVTVLPNQNFALNIIPKSATTR